MYLHIYDIFSPCRETLMGIAKHFETGESLPEDVYEKLVAARTFRAGSLSLRQVITVYWLLITFCICIGMLLLLLTSI